MGLACFRALASPRLGIQAWRPPFRDWPAVKTSITTQTLMRCAVRPRYCAPHFACAHCLLSYRRAGAGGLRDKSARLVHAADWFVRLNRSANRPARLMSTASLREWSARQARAAASSRGEPARPLRAASCRRQESCGYAHDAPSTYAQNRAESARSTPCRAGYPAGTAAPPRGPAHRAHKCSRHRAQTA